MNRRFMALGIFTGLLIGSMGETIWAEEASNTISRSDQQKILVSTISEWRPEGSLGCYAVTDLDGNGRYEVISVSEKSEGEIASQMLEVSESGKSLDACTLDQTDLDKDIDMRQQKVPVYFDEGTGKYYYVFSDEISTEEGADTAGSTISVSMEQGVITCTKLASWEVKEGSVGYADADSKDISADEYEQIADAAYEGLEKLQANIKWIKIKEHPVEGVNMEQVMEVLGESCTSFSVKPEEK